MEFEEKESPDPGLKINPVSLVAIFFLNRMTYDCWKVNGGLIAKNQLYIECFVKEFLKILFVLFTYRDVYFFIEDDPVPFNHFNLI